MNGVMPIDEWPNILSVVLFLTIHPMWSNRTDSVDLRVCGAGKSSISLSIKLALKSWYPRPPMLVVFDFNDEDRPKGERICGHLHDLDDEVRNVTFRIIKKVKLWGDYVASSRREFPNGFNPF